MPVLLNFFVLNFRAKCSIPYLFIYLLLCFLYVFSKFAFISDLNSYLIFSNTSNKILFVLVFQTKNNFFYRRHQQNNTKNKTESIKQRTIFVWLTKNKRITSIDNNSFFSNFISTLIIIFIIFVIIKFGECIFGKENKCTNLLVGKIANK